MRKSFVLLLTYLFALQLGAQTITNYTTVDGLLSDFVECIDVDINDNIWFGTSIGVQMFDGANWTTYNTSNYPGMASDNIKVITSISNGDIWIGTDYGASRFNGTDWVTYTSANGLNNNQVYSIDEDPFGRVWVGTHAGVSYYNGSTWNSYGYPELHWSGVNGTAFDSQGNAWFASPLGGVICKVGNVFIPYDTANGLLFQNVTSILVDLWDNKWIGTGGGISVLDATNTTFTHHTKMYIMPPPDTLNPVVDITTDILGRPWAAIYVGYLAEGGVAFWKSHLNEWTDYDVTDGLAGQNIKGLAIDSENSVWVATSTGVSKILNIIGSISYSAVDNIIIYPNPSNGLVTVVNSGNTSRFVRIYNNLSQLVYDNQIFHNYLDINLSGFDSGIYHLILENEQGIIHKNIIIK